MEHQTLDSGQRIALEDRGHGEPVLLLPGIIGTRATWRPVADGLAADHRVLLPDLLGFGDSTRPESIDEIWADAQARALADVLDARGITRATVAAHDFGGPVAAHLLAVRPDLVRALCLCSTNVTADTPIPMPIAAISWPLVGGVFERILMSGPALRVSVRQALGDVEPRPRVDIGDGAQRRSTRLIFGAALRELSARYAPIEAALRAADLPATVLWGGRDPFFSVEQGRRTAALLDCELELFETAGHFLPLERPAEVVGAVAALAARAHATA